jgi:hypothetical protein
VTKLIAVSSSYFHATLGLYLAKLFAAYFLITVTRVQFSQQGMPSTGQFKHNLRIFILYTTVLLLDEYLSLPRRLTTLWPYWLMLVTTTHLGRYSEPLTHEALIWIDNATTASSNSHQGLHPQRGSPLEPLDIMVSLTSSLPLRHAAHAPSSLSALYLELIKPWKASRTTVAYLLSTQ